MGPEPLALGSLPALQLGASNGGSYTEYLILLTLTLVALFAGLYISFQALRGYRRNDSTRMLYLAIGLALLTVAPFALSVVVSVTGRSFGAGPRVYDFYLPAARQLVRIAGLGCILYSLQIRQ